MSSLVFSQFELVVVSWDWYTVVVLGFFFHCASWMKLFLGSLVFLYLSLLCQFVAKKCVGSKLFEFLEI